MGYKPIIRSVSRILPFVFRNKAVAKSMLKLALVLHNRAYQMAGMVCPYLEPDGLHPKHRLMRYHEWFVERLEKEWNVLDVGCGNGALAYDLQSRCKSILAIDIKPENVERAKAQFSKTGITYVCGDATRYQFKDKFDAIVLSNVLEHIENRVDFLIRLYENQNHERPPVLLLRVPMLTRDWITLYKKQMGVEWRLDRTHFTEYTLEQLEEELDQAGLKIDSYDIQFGEFYGVIRKR